LEQRIEAPAATTGSTSISAGSSFSQDGLGLTNTQENTSSKFAVATQAELIDSEILNGGQVTMSFTNVDLMESSVSDALTTTLSLSGIFGVNSSSEIAFASDVLSLSGLDGTLHVLQVSYDVSQFLRFDGAQLLWRTEVTLGETPETVWINAVLGNSNIVLNLGDGTLILNGDTTMTIADYLSSMRFSGSYENYLDTSDLTAPMLGAWGVDMTNNKVWAVIDHNSEFAVAIPEPGTYLLLLGALPMFMGRRKLAKALKG
jgi:hypothetical protein